MKDLLDQVIEELECDRADGTLQATVTTSKIRYEAVEDTKSLYRQIHEDGSIKTGIVVDGKFVEQE